MLLVPLLSFCSRSILCIVCFPAGSVVMEPRAAHKEGMRVMVVTLFFAVAAHAFLTPVPPLRRHSTLLNEQHQQQYPSGQGAGPFARQESLGAGGLSASLPVDAMTRTEALNGFFAAVVLSTAAVVPPPADRLGVVDDLLADCPSVREGEKARETLVWPLLGAAAVAF